MYIEAQRLSFDGIQNYQQPIAYQPPEVCLEI